MSRRDEIPESESLSVMVVVEVVEVEVLVVVVVVVVNWRPGQRQQSTHSYDL